MAMKAYKSYKDTDQFWLKQIPSHWDIHKIKYVFNERSEKGHPEEPLLVSSQNMGVVPKSVYGNRTVEAMKGLDTLKLVKVGDFVISLRSFQGGIEYAYYQGIISPAYTIMILKGHVTPEYFRHLAKSDAFIKLLKLCVTGIREGQNINYTLLRNYRIPVPPKEEQDQIVRYLDWQNSRLNKLINAKKKEIALLEEQKQALISQAVTKGLDPHAPLKDSGIDWIGQIPEHWEMSYSKKLFNERKDKAFPADIQLTSSQKYGIVSQKEFMEKEGRRVTVVLTGSDILKHVGRGDFVISMRSFQGGLEYSTVEGKISSAYVMLIPRSNLVYDNYFKWLFKSACYIRALQSTSDLVRDGQALRYVNFLKIYLPIVPLNEQKQIADFIDIKTQKLTNVIEKISNKISLLQEYRTRLVADVVTGQIDVRNIAIPNYETVTETIDQPETTEDETNTTEE